MELSGDVFGAAGFGRREGGCGGVFGVIEVSAQLVAVMSQGEELVVVVLRCAGTQAELEILRALGRSPRSLGHINE